MTKNKEKYWPFIIGLVILPILFKLAIQSDIYKDYKRESNAISSIINSIEIRTTVSPKELEIHISNESAAEFKDITIACTYIAQSGTILGEEDHTLYNLFKPKTTYILNDFNTPNMPHQTIETNCKTKEINISSSGILSQNKHDWKMIKQRNSTRNEDLKKLISEKLPKGEIKKMVRDKLSEKGHIIK